jgi:hypothetical protein
MFRMKGAYLTNTQNNKVAWVHGDLDQESRHIYVANRQTKTSYQWDIIYADQWKRDPRKGELNKRFGMYVDRTFYIVSQLGRGRYLDAIDGRNVVIKTRNGRKNQQWYFH